MAPTIIVPVGFDNGPQYAADATESSSPRHYEVVKKASVVTLPRAAYDIWLTAFTDVRAHSALEFTRDYLIDLVEEPDGDTADLVNRLVDSDLLAEFEPGDGSALRFLENHRLFPTGEGFGNTAGQPEVFRIGRAGEVVLEVVSEVYTFWSLSFNERNLWESVQEYESQQPRNAPYNAEQLGQLFASAIPMIVATRTGHLQPA